MQSFFNKEQIEKLTRMAVEAGRIAVEAFNSKKFDISKKVDNSQVTSADIAVSEFLRESLETEFPKMPIICEEGDLREISGDTFFLIDPIDGTSSFISGSEEFTVNIAVISRKNAVFGLIYAPLFEGGKMAIINEDAKIAFYKDITSKNPKIDILEKGEFSLDSGLNIITSKRTNDTDIKDCVMQFYPEFIEKYSVSKISSSVKFLRFLENQSSLYLHLCLTMEWDTAAGQALVEVIGGKVKKISFNQGEFVIEEDLEYQKPDFLNYPFVVFI